MGNKVIILHVDDWAAVYVDGVSAHQGHDVPFFILKDVTDGDTMLRDIDESPYNYNAAVEEEAHYTGFLPDTYEEVERIVSATRG